MESGEFSNCQSRRLDYRPIKTAASYAARNFFAISSGERYSRSAASVAGSTNPRPNSGWATAERMAWMNASNSPAGNRRPFLPWHHVVGNPAHRRRHDRRAGHDRFLHGIWARVRTGRHQQHGWRRQFIRNLVRQQVVFEFHALPGRRRNRFPQRFSVFRRRPEMIVSRKSNSGRNRSSAVNSMSVPLRCPNPPDAQELDRNRLRAAGHLAEDHVRRMFSLVNFRAGELRGEKLDGEVRLGGHHPRAVEADAFDNFSQAIVRGQLGSLLVPGKQTLNRHHIGPGQP